MKKGDNDKLSKVDISVKYICNQLTDPFFVSDANFNIIYANDSFKKMIGKNPIGKKCYKLIHELDKFVKGGAYETAVKTKKAAIIELFEPRLKKWLMIVATPVPKKGKLVVCTQYIKDITERKESEKEFEMLSSIVKQTTEGMAVADLKGNILFCNEAWSEMHGYKRPEELFGKNLAIFHNKEQIEKEVMPFNKKVMELGNFSGEVGHMRKDGKPFPTLIATSVLKDEQGRPYAIAGIAMNIAERKKVQEELKQSQEKYKSLYETSADAIMTLEPPSWKFTSGNPATIRMFKTKDEKEFTSLGPWEVSPEKQPDGQLSSVKAKAMIMKAMKEGSNFFEWTHKRYKGEDFPATVLLTRLEIRGKQFLQATVRDITKLKEEEEEMRLHNEILRNMSEGIYIVGLNDMKIKYANPLFEKMFGYGTGELIGREVSIINAPAPKKTPRQVRDEIVALMIKQKEWHGEIQNIKKDGTKFWCYANASLFSHPKYGKTILTVHSDITKRKEAEELSKENGEKYRLLFEESPLIKALLDEAWNLLEINKKAEEITGYRKEELIGKNVAQMPLFSKEAISLMHANFVRRMRGENVKPYEIDFTDKKGKKHFGVLHGSAISSGGRDYALIAIMDETERISAQRELDAERKKAKVYLDVAGMMVGLDSKGRIIIANRECCRALGYSENELWGKDWFGLCIPANERNKVRKVFSGIMAGAEEMKEYHENRVLAKNGTQRNIFWHNAPLADDSGKITGTLSSGMDVTEMKKSEKEIKEHVMELETFKKFAVNRELKMIELKKKINELEGKKGRL